MFNYDGYINEDYPSFIWLLFPAALISIASGVALYLLPTHTNLVFGSAVVLTIFFEVWLALGGKRWLLAWGLVTVVPLVTALLIAYESHYLIALLVYILPVNIFIAVDAIYYRRIIPGVLHIILALLISFVSIYIGGSYIYISIIYFFVYALIRPIDYFAIRTILSRRHTENNN